MIRVSAFLLLAIALIAAGCAYQQMHTVYSPEYTILDRRDTGEETWSLLPRAASLLRTTSESSTVHALLVVEAIGRIDVRMELDGKDMFPHSTQLANTKLNSKPEELEISEIKYWLGQRHASYSFLAFRDGVESGGHGIVVKWRCSPGTAAIIRNRTLTVWITE